MRRQLNDLMPQPSTDPTIAMIGGGFYSANALGAKDVIDATKPLVDEALRALVPIPSEKPFAVADFGASDGGTSADLMRHMVRTVRTALPDRPITLTYTDLPYNDFSTLFRRLHGMLDADDTQTARPSAGTIHICQRDKSPSPNISRQNIVVRLFGFRYALFEHQTGADR
jgi:hypothetical protein